MRNSKMTESLHEAANSMTDHARDTFSSMNESVLKALEQNRAIMHNMVRALQEESLNFVNLRLQHNGRAIERSRECRGVSELLDLQHQWFMDVTHDYAEMTKRFGEVWREASNEAEEETAHAVKSEAQKVKVPVERSAAAA